MKIVIDHLSGSRRGQRQELDAAAKVRFGRHPECEVSFDALRDIDASSRHAELRPPAPGVGDGWVLVDIGSSNGTYVDGRRITEAPLAAGAPVMVEFGPSGPRLRLFIGDDDQVVQLGAPPVEPSRPDRTWMVVAGVAILAVAVVALLLLL